MIYIPDSCQYATDKICRLGPQFCSGTIAAPEPISYMDGNRWRLQNTDINSKTSYSRGLGDKHASDFSPDKLTTLDRLIDGQIGGLGTALENILGTTRAVPLFEFRNLGGVRQIKCKPLSFLPSTLLSPTLTNTGLLPTQDGQTGIANGYSVSVKTRYTAVQQYQLHRLHQRRHRRLIAPFTTKNPTKASWAKDASAARQLCLCSRSPLPPTPLRAVPTHLAHSRPTATRSPFSRRRRPALARIALWWAVSPTYLRVHPSRAALLQHRHRRRQSPCHRRLVRLASMERTRAVVGRREV